MRTKVQTQQATAQTRVQTRQLLTAFDQTKFDTVMQSIWEEGGKPDTVYLSAFQMNKALGFTGNNNQRSAVQAGDERVIKSLACTSRLGVLSSSCLARTVRVTFSSCRTTCGKSQFCVRPRTLLSRKQATTQPRKVVTELHSARKTKRPTAASSTTQRHNDNRGGFTAPSTSLSGAFHEEVIVNRIKIKVQQGPH